MPVSVFSVEIGKHTLFVFTTCCVSANFNLDGRKVIARILWRMKIMKI